MSEPVRQTLQVLSASRDSNRTKGPWGVNCFLDGNKVMKRPALGTAVAGTTPGQGMHNWDGNTVSIQNDILHVAASTYAL